MTSLETHLRALRDSGRKILVPYFMAGVTPNWTDYLRAAVNAGCDVIEVGLPFSDPMMDGVTIQEAALRALHRDVTIATIVADLKGADIGVPLVAMTYYNVLHHHGDHAAIARLADGGFQGVIVPDLTLEEGEMWRATCEEHDIANIMLVAPSTPPSRVASIVAATRGFCYASARMAVTGAASTEGSGGNVVSAIRAAGDVPALIGIGITTPEQAAVAGAQADGVIVGSAIVQRILDGASPVDIEEQLRTFRNALDGLA
jgi:tryptophan synthase alpha chain